MPTPIQKKAIENVQPEQKNEYAIQSDHLLS